MRFASIYAILFLLSSGCNQDSARETESHQARRFERPSSGYDEKQVEQHRTEGATGPAQDSLSSFKCTQRGKQLVRARLSELLRFKDKADFQYYGFGQGGKYWRWEQELEELYTNEAYSRGDRVAFSDLVSLGLEYVHSHGQETESSAFYRKELDRALDTRRTAPPTGDAPSGGTLHHATVAGWHAATYANRLATCGDWVAAADRDAARRNFDLVKPKAIELEQCITTATHDIDAIRQTDVAEIAAACLMLLGYAKSP